VLTPPARLSYLLPHESAPSGRSQRAGARAARKAISYQYMTGANWVQIGDRLKWDAERGHFNWPLGLAVDAQDRLYIADSCNNRIVRIDDMTGKGWTVFATLSTGEKLYHPSSISIGSDGAIYVADCGNNRIVRMTDMTGKGWQTLNNLDHPVSVRVAADGRLYVGLAYHPGLHLYNSIKGDGHRILKTKSGPRGILAPAGGRVFGGSYPGGIVRYRGRIPMRSMFIVSCI